MHASASLSLNLEVLELDAGSRSGAEIQIPSSFCRTSTATSGTQDGRGSRGGDSVGAKPDEISSNFGEFLIRMKGLLNFPPLVL